MDIDIDTEAGKRQKIFNELKKEFGFDRAINIATFKTEGSSSAIQTICRGMGIDSDTSKYMSSLVPVERGQAWSLKDCLYGNEELDRKPIVELKNLMDSYEGLEGAVLEVEGLICGRSIHASGFYIFKHGILAQNSIMKAPNGQLITAWNMEDSD